MQHHKTLSFLTLFFIIASNTFCQGQVFQNKRTTRSTTSNISSDSMHPCGKLKTITNIDEMPLYVVNDLIISPEYRQTINFLNPDSIASIYVYQKNDSISKFFGDKGKNGVIIIKLKPGIKMLTLKEALSKFNISLADQSLKICINKKLIEHPEKIFFASNFIVDIKIVSDEYWSNNELKSEVKFINIITANL